VETTFEGYNIRAGMLGEMDYHKVTRGNDYAEAGFDTIHSRIASRFTDETGDGHKGLIICIGQMKKADGFAARKYKEMVQNPKAHVTRMTIWESLGWDRFLNEDGTRKSFWYDRTRKTSVPKLLVDAVENPDLMEIPEAYRRQFENNPEKALRDLAGIPPETSDPFISLVDKIELCRERWAEVHGDESPVGPNPLRAEFASWFRANNDPRKRVIHIDMATSGDGDALGIAMGHIDSLVERDDEMMPHITIDCLIRLKAQPGREIILSDVRNIIYHLKNELRFRISKVTIDGFQSTDTMQQLRKRKFSVDYLSVDKQTLPYEDLREAIYEERIIFPKYLTYMRVGDTATVEVALQELMQLTDTGKKIDHPPDGSKDLADAMAGVTHTLMGDRTYRKGVSSGRSSTAVDSNEWLKSQGVNINELLRESPIPPSGTGLKAPPLPGGGLGMTIPDRLRATGRG